MRKAKPKPRQINPDPVYSNRLLTKLVNRCMKDGKKSTAEKQVYKAFELIKEETQKDPLKVFSDALKNVKPAMEVRARRVGGAAYQIPVPVRGPRKESLAIRWLIQSARAKSNSEFHTFSEKLARELIDASNNEGTAVKKRLDTEKMADANKAFSHFKW